MVHGDGRWAAAFSPRGSARRPTRWPWNVFDRVAERMSRQGNEAKSKRPVKPEPELNGVILRKAVVRRLPRRLAGSGQLRLPAMPSQVDEYVHRLQAIF